MQLITIDAEKCKKDSICIIECPFEILAADAEGVPYVRPGMEGTCMRCGHCLAVCPSGAVTLEGGSPEACQPVKKDVGVGEEAMEQMVKTRRSVRVYKDKPVPRETVTKLMDLVRWAPTARNLQPVHWTLVDDRDKIREMARLTIEWFRETGAFSDIVGAWDKEGKDMILRDAPLLSIAHSADDALNPPADCSIALTTLELAAGAWGIGGCWAGFFMRAANLYAPLKKYLGLPQGHNVYAALMMGYPKFSYHRIPARQEAKVRWM